MLYRYFRRAIATVVALVVDDAELPWRHAVYGFAGMDYISSPVVELQCRWQILGCVAYFYAHLHAIALLQQLFPCHRLPSLLRLPRVAGKEVHIVHGEMLALCGLGVVAV